MQFPKELLSLTADFWTSKETDDAVANVPNSICKEGTVQLVRDCYFPMKQLR